VARGYSIKKVDSTLVFEREPLLKFKWVCSMLPYGMDPLYVETINLPYNQFNKKEAVFGGAQYSQYGGFSTVNDFAITFYEDSQASTMAWINEWFKKIKDFATGGYNLPKEYKKHMEFYLLDTTGKDVAKVTLKNTWPISIGDLNLDWVSSERVTTQVNFTCDNVKYEILQLGLITDTACTG